MESIKSPIAMFFGDPMDFNLDLNDPEDLEDSDSLDFE